MSLNGKSIKIKLKTNTSPIQVNQVNIRDAVVILFYKTTLDPLLVKPLEQSIYDHLFGGSTFYTSKYIAMVNFIYDNLIHESLYLVNMLNGGSIPINQVVKLKNYDINPDRWTEIMKKHIQLSQDSKQGLIPNTDRHWCNKCKNNKCYSYYSQDRSQDEGMTLHIICCTQNCNSRWTY